MMKKLAKLFRSSIEATIMLSLCAAFAVVLIGAWGYAMKLRQEVAAGKSVPTIDVRALVEVERIRNLAESQIFNSRSYFLLGSKALYDEQQKEKEQLRANLASFEKKYGLPEIPEIVKRIEALEQQQQDIFDQGMKFRDEQTESKIVGQFYQSKIAPIRAKLNQSLDEIIDVHNKDLERTRAGVRDTAYDVDGKILRGMSSLTTIVAVLFGAMALLVLRMLAQRPRQAAERTRLYEEAQKSALARDEIIVAVSRDLKEPLTEIDDAARALLEARDPEQLRDGVELIRSTVTVAESHIDDILDQTNADARSMTLRLDQMGIDGILDDARLTMQPLAKSRDIRLQFDAVNSPVLAFIDRERVMRVLSSLIGNAIKFSPKHSRVTVKTKSDQQFVYVSVADSGPGIPEAQHAGLFDHFWQARKTADQGAGIGLAVVKTIVEAHGGTVRVDSAAGGGSIFTFSLPRRRPVGANLRRPSATVKQTVRTQSGAAITPAPVSGCVEFTEGPAH